MGGSPSHDSSKDVFCVALKCHHANGELYTVTLKWDSITVSRFYPGHARNLGGHRHSSGLNITSLFQKAAEMKWIFVLCMIGGMVVLGICGADLISSSILCYEMACPSS